MPDRKLSITLRLTAFTGILVVAVIALAMWRVYHVAADVQLADTSRRLGGAATPAPSAATRRPQKGWSKPKGTTTDGTPLRSASPVVPAPP